MQKARTETSNSIRKTSAVILIAIVAMLSGCGRAKSPDRINAAANATVISNKLAAIAVAGEPVMTEQLDKWYVEPPSGENSAEIYVQAFPALSAGDATSSG